jgi:hypothetical protein
MPPSLRLLACSALATLPLLAGCFTEDPLKNADGADAGKPTTAAGAPAARPGAATPTPTPAAVKGALPPINTSQLPALPGRRK